MSFLVNSYLENPWTPTQLGSSLALWLDAADASTVILNGSTVSQWSDKSGNGRHASQGTAANQPTYTASAFAGKTGLTFGGNQVLIGASPELANQTNLNFFGVSIITSRTYSVGFGSGGPAATLGIRWGLFGNGANVPDGIGWAGDSSTPLGNGLLLPVSTPFQSSYIKTPTSWNVFLNGTVISNSIADTTFPTGTYNVRIGAEMTTPLVYAASAVYGEFVITIGALSTADRQRVEGYLAHKWGLAGNLPIDHPYKTTPPTV